MAAGRSVARKSGGKAASRWANLGAVDRAIRAVAAIGLVAAAASAESAPVTVIATIVAVELALTAAIGFSLLYDTFGLDTRPRAARDAPRPFAA